MDGRPLERACECAGAGSGWRRHATTGGWRLDTSRIKSYIQIVAWR
jgi:hypothetical protein